MNLPNKLTMLRIFLVPVFIIFEMIPAPWGKWVAWVVFIAAALTDKADGTIARKYNLITNFGKFMDPLADKLLVCSAMICLVERDRLAAWVVVLIIAREFAISGLRLIAAEKGRVIAAGPWGKAKTVVQMAMCIVMLMEIPALRFLEIILIIGAVALTIISLCDYVVKNMDVLIEQE